MYDIYKRVWKFQYNNVLKFKLNDLIISGFKVITHNKHGLIQNCTKFII